MIYVKCLDDGKAYGFQAKSSIEAINKMVDYLNISAVDLNAKVQKTETNLHLYVEHCGKTYAVKL